MSDQDARTRVLNAAGPIFAEKGFQSATVREICQAADMNVASVNYYFGDKQQLYFETVRRAHESRLAQGPLPDWPEGTPAEHRLHDFVRALLTRMLEGAGGWETRLLMREILQPTAACREMAEAYFRPQFEILLRIVAQLAPHDLPPYRHRQVGYSIVGQCLFYRVAGEVVAMLTPAEELDAHYRIDRLADHIVRFSLGALGRTLPSPEPSNPPTHHA